MIAQSILHAKSALLAEQLQHQFDGNLTILSISLSFSLVLISVPPDPTHARTQTYYECRCSEEFLMHLYVILIVDVGAWFLGGSVRAVLDKVGRHLRWTCKFASEGCTEILDYEDTPRYFDHCQYSV
jgi:hypothetical protein